MTTATLRATFTLSPLQAGIGFGITAVFMWASYLVFAQSAISAGLEPQDIVVLRFGVAGLIILPWLLSHDPAHLAGIGWRRGTVLALIAGPLFIILGASGYVFAPLAHGAVIQPSAIILGGMIAASVFLGEHLTRQKLTGAVVIVLGLVLAAGFAGSELSITTTWMGDLMFLGAGSLWAAFTILLKRWRVSGLAATAVVSVLSAAFVVPAFALFDGFDRLLALPVSTLLTQVIVQGVLAGLIAVIVYGAAVGRLGAGRSSLFPALVPAVALVLGFVVTGTVPSVLEITGATVATVGVLIALGVVSIPRFYHRTHGQPS